MLLRHPFDAERLQADESRSAMVARLRIAHVDGVTADHMGQQFLGRLDSQMRALLALAGEIFAIAIAMRNQHDAGFFAFFHQVRDG